MKKHSEGWDVCEHCGKGEEHWVEWDFPSGRSDGGGACKKGSQYGGCVGDWSCSYDPVEEARQKYLDSLPKPGERVYYYGEPGYFIALDPHLEGWGWVRAKYGNTAERVPMNRVDKAKGQDDH